MHIDDPQISADKMAAFAEQGVWTETTTNERLEQLATEMPNKLAIVDNRLRLTYGEYATRVKKLARQFVSMGITRDDVIAIQLPNWIEFAIAINAAMFIGTPFCQFHSDFRSREVEFILQFTNASVLIIPHQFHRNDYLQMLQTIQPRLPHLKHVMVVGDDVPPEFFDLRGFLDESEETRVDEAALLARRPVGNDLARVAFTSGTTGDPKAVLHLHNTTNAAFRLTADSLLIDEASVMLIFVPVGLNWGLFNTLQALFAGATLILQDRFSVEMVLDAIEAEGVTHLFGAPAHLVSLLNYPDLQTRDLSSLRLTVTGGASCPIEVIRDFRSKFPGHFIEMYGMLESGYSSMTLLSDDPEAVCGLVGRPVHGMGVKVVDEAGRECTPDEVGEIIAEGPTIMIGYFNNPEANKSSFTGDGWLRTGDLGSFDNRGYLKIAGRKKEMIIRGGANIYPREIEEVLYQHPKVLEAAVVGVPDPRLGERACACIIPKPGQSLSFEEMTAFLRDKIATYKLPEHLQIVETLPRTPTGKIQKGPLREFVLERMQRLTADLD